MQIDRKVHDGKTIIALNLAKSNPNFGTSVKKSGTSVKERRRKKRET